MIRTSRVVHGRNILPVMAEERLAKLRAAAVKAAENFMVATEN